MDVLQEELRAQGIPFVQNEPLQNHTSFKIGGPARLFCTPGTTQQLAAAMQAARQNGVPCYLLGKGTNVLFCDEGHHGLVIEPSAALTHIAVEGDTVVAGAGTQLANVCVAAQQNSLAGLEFAYGIPGSVGGAVYMNAGAYGGETCDVLQSVTYMAEDGTIQQLDVEQLALGYRTSIFQTRPWCILTATYKLNKGNKAEILALMQDYMGRREDKQPLDMPSAGSAFKRPPGAFAGALIDQSGLRGYQVGGAAISQKHCGFIVNMGQATCADVLQLANDVSDIVKEKTGYVLEKEIRVVDVDANIFALE
ncbi:UDP-N-acetylmuramate dehydrogenase [Ruminococcaceae bacterium OttesenSCG-928-A16]|nr:UDP-N-acetylmuramate dehydrogenase [Ruminococcaceae bacterium OttesenSCG-928-A16]